MHCQESQMMCTKRKAYSHAYICIYTKLFGLEPGQTKWNQIFFWIHVADPCTSYTSKLYIYYDPSCQYQHWKFVLIVHGWAARTPSFLFMAVSFCNATLWKKEKVMEKQQGIDNCEECGMFNGTLGPYVDWLFRFLLCNSSRSIPTCPVAPLFFSETFDGDEQISALLGSFYFKGTIFPKHGKSVLLTVKIMATQFISSLVTINHQVIAYINLIL